LAPGKNPGLLFRRYYLLKRRATASQSFYKAIINALSKSPLHRQLENCYHPFKMTDNKKIIKIHLDLGKHCIQTAVKRKYNQLISNYFKLKTSENAEIIESEISLLKDAMENCDFSWLRSTYPELQGGGADKIMISASPDNDITISINDRKIHATNQNH